MSNTKKIKPKSIWHEIIECPVCKSKTFEYVSYSEYEWGTVEQHGYCDRCGYVIEQAYSPVYDAFIDIKRGYKDYNGNYHPKDVKRHKRIRRKHGIKNIEVNPAWVYYL